MTWTEELEQAVMGKKQKQAVSAMMIELDGLSLGDIKQVLGMVRTLVTTYSVVTVKDVEIHF